MTAAKNIRDYAIITATYWAFTLSDGALRMLVLLHLHELGHSPLTLAMLFVLYEFFGMGTNLFGGWLGARSGLKITLGYGLLLQVIACGLLALADGWLSVALVTALQGLSGIAKDLTKMSSKSYIKMVVPDGDQAGLLRWVALLTGSKNTLKGVGYFLGGLLLSTAGFHGACGAMSIALALTLVASMLALPKAPGKAKASVSLKSLIPTDARLGWLSAARLFLFGSRDTWFVVGLPVFLSATLGWSFEAVGAALALWIIGYGIVQASAPAFLGLKTSRAEDPHQRPVAGKVLGKWKAALIIPLAGIAFGLEQGAPVEPTLIGGLVIFGIIFAANSALHSFLVVNYAEKDSVALSVGFYYMSNAAGRLVGTVLSGILFESLGGNIPGLLACMAGAMVMVGLSTLLCIPLSRAEHAFNAAR